MFFDYAIIKSVSWEGAETFLSSERRVSVYLFSMLLNIENNKIDPSSF